MIKDRFHLLILDSFPHYHPQMLFYWMAWTHFGIVCVPASHYCGMLETEGVTELLKSLSAHADTHADIRGLSDSILHMLDEHQSHSGTVSR